MADLPDLPNLHALACMLITVVALFMFAKDRWPLEITSLSLLVLLASGFALLLTARLPISTYGMVPLAHSGAVASRKQADAARVSVH